ncbi:hypothetical protein KC19_9G061100 [Ceratodon purpureus]|uniref:Uncharacterized protein n=1 Tax=Ceratodon purpureus TaxID=3225 RepID=A0A8T0GUN2_CERPU|nr:hypothetical protein KC19_9G061100 [Ceratodon purpureus]
MFSKRLVLLKDVSDRASSESGESAESAVTDSSLKETNHGKQSSFSVTSVVGKLCEPDAAAAAPSVLPIKIENEQENLEEESSEESLEEDVVNESPPCETTEAMAGSMAGGDALSKPSPQLERPKKHSSSSNSTTSEPTLMEPRKFAAQGNKNAAELKPTGLPTNYKKADAPSLNEWSSSLKLQESKSKHKGKMVRQERLKMHTMATVARLSAPKVLAAQRVCHVKATPEVKRNDTPLKLDGVMRFATPKIIATQKCQLHRTATPERSKPRVKKDVASKCSSPFVERLGDIQERINSSKRAKKIREKEERDMCSFHPNINCKYLDVEGYQPIEKRLDCIREQKDKMIKTARDQEAKDLGITFRPELNPNSVRILKERAALKSPALTLDINDDSRSATPQNYSNNYWADLPESRPKAGDLSRSVSVCTFVPEINSNTEHILAGTPLEGCDFLTRQQQFLDRIEQRKRLKQQEIASGFTFQPERGNAEFILSCSPFFKIDENLSEMCERLSKSDHQRRFSIQQQMADNYYSQFAFHPHVDETSRLIGRNPSIETLFSDVRAKHHKELLRQLAQEEFQRTCTFRPMVKVSSYPIEEAVLEERKKMKMERKKQEERERISKELEELAECTFKPVINPWPPKEPDGGLQIKGVQRHLELQRLAKQMKIDQAEWEKKIFFSHQNNERPRQQYTIPKPFNFHTGSCNDHCPGSPVNRRNRMPPSMPIDPHLCT